MAVINQINLVNNVGEAETYDIETKITSAVREYIQNQTVPGSIETLTVPNTQATEYTAEYDMEVFATASSVSNVPQIVYVNHTAIARVNAPLSGQAATATITFTLLKGDTFYITRGSTSVGAPFAYCRKYLSRDYSGRV